MTNSIHRAQPQTLRQAANTFILLAALLWQTAGLAQDGQVPQSPEPESTVPIPIPEVSTPVAPMPEATGASTTFSINGFDLTGEVDISTDECTRILAPFIGPDATIETLQKATAALEAAFKAKGLALHRVTLPPQEVGKNVTLNIVKFVIGKVTVEGNTLYSQANVRASVPELKEGQAPNFSTMAIQTAIANENPSKQVQVSLKESDEADKIDVMVLVKEAKPWNFSASLANTGSEATGQDRLSLVGGHANVLDRDHQFSGAYTTSVERINDVKQLGLNYRIPFYRQGGVMGLSYTSSDVVGNFGAFSSTGAGQTYGVNYNHYLAPDGGRRTHLDIGLDEKQFNASLINGMPVPGQADRSSRPLTLGYNTRVESNTAVWGYNVDFAVNLPGSNGNDLAAYQKEDARISNVNWKLLRGAANYLSSTESGWLWGVRGQFQYSPTALISGEQFGLGGVTSVRGTAERPISGDSGCFMSLELTTPDLEPGLKAMGFVDAGWLSSHDSYLNANKPSSDQLLSAGLGLRYALGACTISVDWARLLAGSVLPFTPGSAIPQDGDQRFHVSLSVRF